MKPYTHKVQYYETDMIGVAHHANYIHWMEEARIDFMDQLGFPYAEMEKKGFFSPVKAVSCEYRHPCTFGDIRMNNIFPRLTQWRKTTTSGITPDNCL